jgi:hypothetical protein
MTMFYGDPSFPTRFGTDVAGAGTATDLFLQVFGGEVLEAFTEATIMRGKHHQQTITSGKSAQFPRLWKLNAEYHTAGQEMLGQTTSQTEVVITLDGMIVSPFAIYDLDQAMTHYDVRSVYSNESGASIARVYDQNVMRQIILAARATATSPFPAGKRITTADLDSVWAAAGATLTTTPNALGLLGALRAARKRLRDVLVPDSVPVWCAVSPTRFDQLKYVQLPDAAATSFGPAPFLNKDINAAQTGMGETTESLRYEGITIIPSSLLPSTDESVAEDVYSKYRGDYSNTVGIVWCPQAVGTLELLGLTMEMERTVRRKETFVVASMACGHGALRQELAMEITNLASV